MIKVSVTAEDIAEGRAGNCHDCPVALAVLRAVGDTDTEVSVYDHDWVTYIQVGGRCIPAPHRVAAFISQFDMQPRLKDMRANRADPKYKVLLPFDFDLPGDDDPDWREHCYHCNELFEPAALDGEGVCKGCLAED